MAAMLTLVVALLLVASPAGAQRAQSPADATVFIRLVGSVHVDIDEAGVRQTADLEHVEIGTGSGFVISPYGYVLTNDHVVDSREQTLTRGMRRTRIAMTVSRIDVCFRPDVASARGLLSPCVPASVTASDPALDLAVLSISAPSLPYIALGDSDAVATGLAVDALGYPFGRAVEVGKLATLPDLVPDVSTTPGAVSALRADDAGERRYLQVTNVLNPGNSGGPLVDRDGFAVGVIRMKLANATGIGFAIPVNQAKEFLEAHGLDQLMPVRRLRLGAFQHIDAKRIGLRLPEGLADLSPSRSRVEVDARPADIALRIDRVLSPWSPRQIAQALVGTHTFETLSMAAREGRIPQRPGAPPLLLGGASGTTGDVTQEKWMDYGVLDLGPERLVARYVGSAEWMAFNESVLRQSLASLQGQRLARRDLVPAEKLEWSAASPVANGANGERAVPLPAGWTIEPWGPSPCAGLPQPGTATAGSPADDFTFVLRAAVWPAGDVVPDTAARACSPRRGSLGGASYTSRTEWLGVSYVIEGVFTRVGPTQIVQLEVLSTEPKSALASAVLAAWLRQATD